MEDITRLHWRLTVFEYQIVEFHLHKRETVKGTMIGDGGDARRSQKDNVVNCYSMSSSEEQAFDMIMKLGIGTGWIRVFWERARRETVCNSACSPCIRS